MSSNWGKAGIFSLIFIFTLTLLNVKSADFSVVQGINPGSICPGTTSLFTDIVTNKGTNDLEFTVTNTGSSSGFTTTVPPGFILKSGQSRTIYTYVSPRTTTKVGRYTLELNVASGSETETISHSIDVKDCSSFEVKAIDTLKEVCPTDIEKYDFEVTNTGEFTETFDLRVEGQAAPWSTLSEKTITLGRKETKTIFVYLTTSSDSLGSYDFSLVAEARTNKKVQSSKSIIKVNPCFSYDLTTAKDLISLCENSVEILPVDITNRGTVVNTYNLQIEGPEWASLENNKVVVGSGETRSVNIVVNPGYGIEGDFKVLFKSSTAKGNIESRNEFSVNVKKCHNVELQIEKNQDKICNSLSNTYNVFVKNTGEFKKEFKFELDGPVWSSFERGSIKLEAGEERQLTLTINPGLDVVPGDYDIRLRTSALDTSKVSSEDILTITTISREDCYKPSIGIANKEINVYYDSAATVPVVIENKGNLEATYDISVSGTATNFMHLNPAIVTIEPNMAEVVYLYIAPTSETVDGDYSATVAVRLKDSTILESDSLVIKVSKSKVPIEEIIPEEEKPVEEKKSFWQRIKEFFAGQPVEQQPPITEVPTIEITENVTEIPEVNITENITEVAPEVTGEVSVEIAPGVVPEARNIDFNIANKHIVNQQKNQNVTFSVDDEEHSVKVTDISSDSITIVVRSEPQFSNLKVGESKDFDTNNDGINDLRVTLIGIEDGKARLVYEDLQATPSEEVTETVTEENETAEVTGEVTEEIPETTTKQPNFFLLYKNYIITGIVILILLILIIKYRKAIKEFFEEEVEEIPQPKKESVREVKKEELKKEEIKKEEKKQGTKKKKEVSEEEYY